MSLHSHPGISKFDHETSAVLPCAKCKTILAQSERTPWNIPLFDTTMVLCYSCSEEYEESHALTVLLEFENLLWVQRERAESYLLSYLDTKNETEEEREDWE